jgi:hypothetical protein
MVQHLPQEIVDIIIHNLHPDIKALSVCSLVCKSWLPASYHHIFNKIILRPSNFDTFLTILRSPYGTAAPFIREVVIQDIFWQAPSTAFTPNAGSDSMSADLEEHPPRWALDDVLPLVQLLTSASILYLDSGNWSEVESKPYRGLPGCFSGIKELSITRSQFKTFDHAIEIISAFSQLESLHLDNVGWDYDSEDLDIKPGKIEPSPPSRLRHLGLGYCYKRDVLNWFLRHQPTHAVSSVDLGTIFGLNTPSIGNYLHSLAGSLEHLQLGFCGLDAGGDAGLSLFS